eukprot:Lithocolla_globosa_v1_NODE_3276_length_1712_cov_33.325287.p1 type:complete len:489 gc:universal NODE_3276_length_1712_cov_33.325287:97-1563(+)
MTVTAEPKLHTEEQPLSNQDDEKNMEPDEDFTNPTTFLCVNLTKGVSRFNMFTFYYAVLWTITSYVFVNAAQPYILREVLGLDELGVYTGQLGSFNELMIIATVTTWGVISDKLGRKFVYVNGFILMATSFILQPYSTSYGVLVLYRLIFALGASACAGMLTSVLADYVGGKDKGIASGWMGVFSGSGALVSALFLLRIPEMLTSEDLDSLDKARIMYLIVGLVTFVSGVLLFVGLQGRTDIQKNNRTVPSFLIWVDGFKAAWNDRRLALAYASGFVARGDSVVLTTFLSLWVQDYCVKVLGQTSEQAATKAGVITGIAQSAALAFAMIAGYLSTKIDIVLSLAITTAIAVVGYTAICFTDDPTSTYGVVCGCIIGIGEIGVIISSQAFCSRISPRYIRGSVGGTFGLCGSIGVLVCSYAGGILYDSWDESGPFLLFACFNLVLLFWSLGLYIYERYFLEGVEDEIPYSRVPTNVVSPEVNGKEGEQY